jgi:hypothetical protein
LVRSAGLNADYRYLGRVLKDKVIELNQPGYWPNINKSWRL